MYDLGFWLLQGRGNGGGPGGLEGLAILLVLLGLAILILNIVATIDAIKGRLATLGKVLWILGIWLFSPVGMILYFLLGRTRR